MDLKHRSYIIYVADLETLLEENPFVITDFLSNDMQIILKDNLVFTEVEEHINPKEWFEEDNETVFEDYDINFYYIDWAKSSETDSICMYYDDNDSSFNLGYDESTKNREYLFFALLYNFIKKMLLLCDIEVENITEVSYKNYLIKTDADIALFLDDNISFSELYGFEKSSDMIKYLAVPYTDAIKIKDFPKEWLI